MKVYHRTRSQAAAASILSEGFRDAEGHYATTDWWRGVWIADRPLDVNDYGGHDEPGDDPCLFVIEIPETLFAEYEWVEEDRPEECYRESLVPAAILNTFQRRLVVDEDEAR